MTDSTNQTAVAILCEEDHLPWKIAKPLFENQVEFNYLEESLFLSLSELLDGKIEIANQSYQTVIIEDSRKLDSTVIDKLERFIQSGGEVVDLEKDSTIQGAKIIHQEEDVVDALSVSHLEEVVISSSSHGIKVSKVLKDGQLFYFFVNEGEENYKGVFRLKQEGSVEKWDHGQERLNKLAFTFKMGS